MKGDLAFTNPKGGGFDFAANGADLVLSDGLVELLIHGLFRDGRAPASQIGADEDPRGHWSSGLDPQAADGSLLWLLEREKITPDMPARVEEIISKALDFMVRATTGPAASVVGVNARAQKASPSGVPVRGRIDAQVILQFDSGQLRRFGLVHDRQNNSYSVRERPREPQSVKQEMI